MMVKEVNNNQMHDKKSYTRLALLEQSSHFMQASLDRMDKKLNLITDTLDKNNEKLNHKIEKLEAKIESKIKWLFNNIIMVFFSSSGLALTAYEIWRKL